LFTNFLTTRQTAPFIGSLRWLLWRGCFV